MKVQRKISPTTLVEAEGQTAAEVFEALASLEAVFCGHETCGLCGKTGVRYEVQRDDKERKYFKVVCLACGAEFRFGQRVSPVGMLFPQLKDKDGNTKPSGGWAQWQGANSVGRESYTRGGRGNYPDEH